MLNKEAEVNIKLIKTTAEQVWGNNVEFGEIKVLNSPYPEFEWIMRLYTAIDIFLIYDRSTLDIGVPKNGQYVLMSEYTDKLFFRGLESTQPENLLNNFHILNDVVKKIMRN